MASRHTLHHEPFDVTGNKIHVVDWVRVVGVLDLSAWAAESRAESLPVFEYLVGKYKRVRGFDRYGHVELRFTIRTGSRQTGSRQTGSSPGIHWIWIEPCLLRVRRTRRHRARVSGAQAGAVVGVPS